MDAILVKSKSTVSKMAREDVNISAGFFKLLSLVKEGTCFILLSIANKREEEKILAMTPETVAIMAMPMVIQEPHSPKTGFAAAARA